MGQAACTAFAVAAGISQESIAAYFITNPTVGWDNGKRLSFSIFVGEFLDGLAKTVFALDMPNIRA